MSHIEIALIGLTTICLLLLPIALLFLRRIAHELVSLNRQAAKILQTDIDGIAQTAAKTAVQSAAETGDLAQDATILTELSDSMAEMKRDFEWLVSTSMIELAINMASTGQSQERIAKHTGISTSELDAIRKVAKH